MFKTAIILAVAFVAVASASGFGTWGEEGRYHGKFHPMKRNQFARRPIRAGSFGAGSSNNFDAEEGRFGAINANNLQDSHNFAEGDKSGLISDRHHFDTENDDVQFDDVGAIRKHQVQGSDKTIIKDKSFGVNDVDGFHKTHANVDRDRLSSGHEFLGAGREHGRIQNDRFDSSNLNAVGGDQKDVSASSHKGIGASGFSA